VACLGKKFSSTRNSVAACAGRDFIVTALLAKMAPAPNLNTLLLEHLCRPYDLSMDG
jgi:hypothetical protein